MIYYLKPYYYSKRMYRILENIKKFLQIISLETQRKSNILRKKLRKTMKQRLCCIAKSGQKLKTCSQLPNPTDQPWDARIFWRLFVARLMFKLLPNFTDFQVMPPQKFSTVIPLANQQALCEKAMYTFTRRSQRQPHLAYIGSFVLTSSS